MGLFADAQARGSHVNAAGRQMVHLAEKDRRVQHHAVADQTDFAVVQDAGRDEVQNGFLALDLDGVPGVVAALKADNDLAPGAEHVHNLALALVAPLRADDDRVRHCFTCLESACGGLVVKWASRATRAGRR